MEKHLNQTHAQPSTQKSKLIIKIVNNNQFYAINKIQVQGKEIHASIGMNFKENISLRTLDDQLLKPYP